MTGANELQAITPAPGGLTLTGEIDAHTAPQLGSAIDALEGDVDLDLAGVEFVDSSGLRVIIEAHRAMAERGARLRLRDPSDAVRRLLEISGVEDYLHVV